MDFRRLTFCTLFACCMASVSGADESLFRKPPHFPEPHLPADNPLTAVKVELGSDLFSDSRLSIDGSMSCVACHDPELAFGDDRRISRGFNNSFGTRHSMPLFNLAWKTSFFWDGRADSIRAQVLEPIQARHEMAAHLPTVLRRLNRSRDYRKRFEQAFGSPTVTAETLGMALEAFLLTLTSADSRYDRALSGRGELTEQEARGQELFFTEAPAGGSCYQCHNGPTFTDSAFRNNGLASPEDAGRERATSDPSDRGKFVTPSVRNVSLTAPYMHDGRFKTLKDVLAHYAAPFSPSATLAPELAAYAETGLPLTPDDQAALVAFLLTLEDPQFTE